MPVLSPCRRVEGSHVSVAPLDKLGIASKRGELVEPYRGAGFPLKACLRVNTHRQACRNDGLRRGNYFIAASCGELTRSDLNGQVITHVSCSIPESSTTSRFTLFSCRLSSIMAISSRVRPSKSREPDRWDIEVRPCLLLSHSSRLSSLSGSDASILDLTPYSTSGSIFGSDCIRSVKREMRTLNVVESQPRKLATSRTP